MEKITLSIYVPCFNEENNIVNTLNKIKEAIQHISYEVLVVDDASKDKTIEVVEKFKKDNSDINIKIFRNENNRGIGFNYRATAHRALGKYYMMITGDAPEISDDIKKVVNNIGKADIILTYIIDKRGIFRRTLSIIYSFIINLITLNNLKYYNGPNIHLVENVKSYRGKVSGFNFQAGLIIEQIRQKKTYIEIPIDPYLRTSGTSKSLTSGNIIRVIGTIISIFLNQIIYVLKKILNKL